MRLHRLVLRHFRGVAEREVTFDTNGVTVVVGDNETGKSSLLEALALVFELPDDSKAAKLRAVQPAGQDVPTEVRAEVSFGDVRLHYRKQWFRQRATELRLEPGGQTWTGREAHDEAGRLFAEHVDQTLWAALIVGQEHALSVPAAGSVAAVLTALDEAAGGEVDHGASVPLVEAVEREYLRYFTRTGRPTGEYSEAQARRDDVRAQVIEAEDRLAALEQDIARAERFGRDLAVLSARLDEQTGKAAELEAERNAGEELIARVDRLRRDADLANQRLTAERGELERRQLLVAEARQRADSAAAASEAALSAAAALRSSERELEACTAALRTSREAQTERRSAVRRLDGQLTRLRDQADLAELAARLVDVEEARVQERRTASELTRLTIDDAAVDAAEAAHREVLLARAALAAGSPSIVVRQLGSAQVEVGGSVLDEAEAELRAERDTTIAVPGVVEVTVRPGAGATELAAAYARAEHTERELLAEFGVADVAEVRRAGRARAEAVRALDTARETLTRRLDGASPDELVARRDLLADRVAETEATADSLDEQSPLPGTVEETRAALVRAQEEEATAARLLADAEARESQHRKEFETASGADTEARVRAEQETERRDDAQAALVAARSARSDETLAAAVVSAEAVVVTVVRDLEQVEETLAASGIEQLDDRISEAAALRQQLAAQVEELHDDLRRVEGRLEMAGVQGLASAVERARADLAQVEGRLQTLERRALAASRLRDTLARHRAEARRRYAAPLRERIDALGRFVYGPSFGVVLGDDLEVRARTLHDHQLPVSSLSTGAREQLATVVRLAIAALTATDGSGVPVVLDDALGWSDPGRLGAMGSLLARAGASSQVVLLTCVPDRYAGTVAGARIIRV
ncbi:ATP-binding protein [Actinopolymorpha alba]|uniref:ATP-binding protein n=1 Tax=Actinopolymorpha alba TaxID=533267 RepID=UPI00035EE912|nr:AAA family ATPase [Actinopolymorpha alba]